MLPKVTLLALGSTLCCLLITSCGETESTKQSDQVVISKAEYERLKADADKMNKIRHACSTEQRHPAVLFYPETDNFECQVSTAELKARHKNFPALFDECGRPIWPDQ